MNGRSGRPCILSGIITGLAGMLLAIPALKVRGPYLAMVTIAFGFVVEQSAAEWQGLTGGWNGLSGIPGPSVFGDRHWRARHRLSDARARCAGDRRLRVAQPKRLGQRHARGARFRIRQRLDRTRSDARSAPRRSAFRRSRPAWPAASMPRSAISSARNPFRSFSRSCSSWS